MAVIIDVLNNPDGGVKISVNGTLIHHTHSRYEAAILESRICKTLAILGIEYINQYSTPPTKQIVKPFKF